MEFDASLDIVIGESKITRNNFSTNSETQSCAFPSGGLLSIITLTKRENVGSERRDIIVSETTTSISAISFSKSGNSIAVGEDSPNSRVFILEL